MKPVIRSDREPVRFEETMRRRIDWLGREGRVGTLTLYTDSYYPPEIRRAAILAIGSVASWEAGAALFRMLFSAGDDLAPTVREAVFRWCDGMDIGALSAAVFLSRVSVGARSCRLSRQKKP